MLLPFDAAETVFLVMALSGCVLLLLAVFFDDILGGLLDAVNIDVDLGGVSLMPVLLGFVAMFGVGGLIGTRLLGLPTAPATVVGLVSGVAGSSIVFAVFNFLKRSEAPGAFSLQDLVGSKARVAVAIPARRSGSVHVRAAGTSQELTATADTDIPSGEMVEVADVAGSVLVVRRAAGEGNR